ncbi:disulfide bond formation protein B [Phenylobacterium sp.]|uniref:disulfide bond formation protein B n=1 Tax=Phenylobacterium sp. TaxID=1871053 RepID=UPI002E34720A|nr:disulfide bond formation protein B [Phenylobacterium sp.]HEX2559122.1 disulfide bond formation protein B [Phenylobacterium sp.]
MSKLDPVLTRWPLLAFIASAAMLAAAHIFQRLGYAPCVLCLKQREVYWVAGGLALAGLVLTRLMLKDARWRAALNLILGLVFLAGVGLAAYHAGVEWKFWPGPEACAPDTGVSAEDMGALLSGEAIEMPSCDEAAWVFLGLSMAGWNALASLALAILSLAAARKEWSRR